MNEEMNKQIKDMPRCAFVSRKFAKCHPFGIEALELTPSRPLCQLYRWWSLDNVLYRGSKCLLWFARKSRFNNKS